MIPLPFWLGDPRFLLFQHIAGHVYARNAPATPLLGTKKRLGGIFKPGYAAASFAEDREL